MPEKGTGSMDTSTGFRTTRFPAVAPRRRRRLLPVVDSRFQWKYTALVVAVVVLLGGTMGVLLQRAWAENTHLLLLGNTDLLGEELRRGDRWLLGIAVLGLLGIAACVLLLGLILTHRISGPVWLFERYLTRLGQGYWPTMRPLRKRDELHGLFDALEEALGALRKRHEDRLDELDRLLVEVAVARARGDGERALDDVTAWLRREQEDLQTRLRMDTAA